MALTEPAPGGTGAIIDTNAPDPGDGTGTAKLTPQQATLLALQQAYPGLPADIAQQAYNLIVGGGDGSQVVAYIRSTDWWKQLYPGFDAAFKTGLIANESDYRTYLNQATQLYRQYFNRDITSAEFAGYLNQGIDIGRLAGTLNAQAYATANGPEDKYLLGAFGGTGPVTQDQIDAYSKQVAGGGQLNNPLGMKIQAALAQAQARMATVFTGRLAGPAGLSLEGGQLGTKQAQQTPDLGS